MYLRLRRTPFDLVLLLFVLTAGVGVGVSYNWNAAWGKFFVVLAAVAVYYLLACASRGLLWAFAGLLGGIGGGYTLLFLAAHNWQQQPADLGIIQHLAQIWMNLRPSIAVGDPGQNVTGGVVAAILPLYLAFMLGLWQNSAPKLRAALCSLLGLLLAGLVMSSSRGAWLALAAGLSCWAAWQGSLWLAKRRGWPPAVGLVIPLLALVLIGMAATGWFASSSGLTAFGQVLPDSETASSRVQIARGALYLAGETPFLGGGLAAFPGLYSEYIRRIWVFEFGYAHNLYLDVAVEQGAFGVAALIVILVGSLLLTASQVAHSREAESQMLGAAVFASLMTICLHGLVDNPLYGMIASPWLFAAPGMAVALWARTRQGEQAAPRLGGGLFPLASAAALGVGFLFLAPGSFLSTWHANLGAVEMAHIQLAGFPHSRPTPEQVLAIIQPAQAQFEQALQLDADNPAPHYRLGLIALDRRDFPAAVSHLESAYAYWPRHRGVQKSLGYAYLWNQQSEPAAELLAPLSEIPDELDAYTYWWEAQNRTDLAALAAQFVKRLRGR